MTYWSWIYTCRVFGARVNAVWTSHQLYGVLNRQRHDSSFNSLLGQTNWTYQSFALLRYSHFVKGTHRWPNDFTHKWPLKRKVIPCRDVTSRLYLAMIIPNANITNCSRTGYQYINPASETTLIVADSLKCQCLSQASERYQQGLI